MTTRQRIQKAAPPAKRPTAPVVAAETAAEPTHGEVVPAAPAYDLRKPIVRESARVVRVPFSSKIDIDLQARAKSHCHETGETMIDLIERGIRLALGDDYKPIEQ